MRWLCQNLIVRSRSQVVVKHFKIVLFGESARTIIIWASKKLKQVGIVGKIKCREIFFVKLENKIQRSFTIVATRVDVETRKIWNSTELAFLLPDSCFGFMGS